MVVKTQRPKDRKIKETFITSLKNYLRSLVLLNINSNPPNTLLAITTTLFLNTLTATIPLKFSVYLYAIYAPLFSFFNGFFLVLTEKGMSIKTPEDRRALVKHLLFYSYLTLLVLTYLPLYVYLSRLSQFIQPVSLIVYFGLYSIFFLNNTKKGGLTPITNSLAIFVFVYLCVDNIK